MVKKAKITVYCCGLFLDSILSKRAGFSIFRSNFSQGPYSNIIHTLIHEGQTPPGPNRVSFLSNRSIHSKDLSKEINVKNFRFL